jgi:thiamine-monophosphate kinase
MRRDRGEDALTAKIAAAARRRSFSAASRHGAGVRVGIGDDAAVVDLGPRRCVLTTDTLVEGIDFFPGELPYWIGRRAAAANLSDIAAMGAIPLGFLLSLGIRTGKDERYAYRIVEGAIAKMAPFRASLWGGDLSRAPATFVTMFVIGAAAQPVARAGARPGDRVFVTGRPGSAAAALAVRRKRVGRPPSKREKAYLDPEPRVEFASRLSRRGWATAMIDVSDGLAKDAHRLASASRVRLALIGLSPTALGAASDDFELLFTSPPSRRASIFGLGRRLHTPLAEIGRVERGRGVTLERDGRRRLVADRGYDHFA